MKVCLKNTMNIIYIFHIILLVTILYRKVIENSNKSMKIACWVCETEYIICWGSIGAGRRWTRLMTSKKK